MQDDQSGSGHGPGGDQRPPDSDRPQVSPPGGSTPWRSADDTAAFGSAGSGDTVSFGRSDDAPGAPGGPGAPGEQQAGTGGPGTFPAGSYGPGQAPRGNAPQDPWAGPGTGHGGGYGQPGGYGQGGYGQPGNYTQPGNHGQGGYGQPGNYTQPGNHGQGGYGQGGYGPPGNYTQGGYGQPGNYAQGGYGQPGNYGQPGDYGAGGGYGSGGGYGQPGGYGYGGWGSPAGGYGDPPPRKRRGLAVLAVVAVLAAAAGAGTAVALNSGGGSTGVSSNDVPAPQNNGSNGSNGSTNTSLNASAVAAKVEPGVVDITSTLNYQSETAEGTGMVLSTNGLVLTNNHVINGATSIKATEVTSGKTYTARVVGYDAADDVALLQLQNASGLKAVAVGNSSQVTLGTPVLAIGNAGGQGGNPTVAPGIVNATNRTITAGDQGSGTTETLHGMLQTSAQIQPGDSGGPLANASGKVIGMDTAASSSVSASSSGSTMGYAIPINAALSIARQIAAGHGSSTIQIGLPGFLGVLVPQSSSSSPQQQAQQQQQNQGGGFGGFGGTGNGGSGGGSSSQSCVNSATANTVPSTIAPASSGALIDNVLCGSAAATAGLAAGDVITAVNGQAVTSPSSLTTIMSKYHGGDKVSVSYVATGGGTQAASLTLGTSPAK